MTTTTQVDRWRETLTPKEQTRITAAIAVLREHGPDLGRPVVDSIKGSKYHNMKELRPLGKTSHLRVLFAFDKRSTAVLLVGGDKTNDWNGWYRRNLRTADRELGQHLQRTGQETRCQKGRTQASNRPTRGG